MADYFHATYKIGMGSQSMERAARPGLVVRHTVICGFCRRLASDGGVANARRDGSIARICNDAWGRLGRFSLTNFPRCGPRTRTFVAECCGRLDPRLLTGEKDGKPCAGNVLVEWAHDMRGVDSLDLSTSCPPPQSRIHIDQPLPDHGSGNRAWRTSRRQAGQDRHHHPL